MRTNVRWMLAAVLAATMGAGCSSPSGDDSGTGGGAGGGGPAPTVDVYFTIDDSANKVFTANDGGASDLEWKGGFKFTKETGKIVEDSSWGGPFPALYDDGPTTAGGHEPPGNVAGDHKWGISVKVETPATATKTYEYGAQDATTSGWLWRGDNGKFTVAAGATAPITATGLTLLPFGTTNLIVTLDTTALPTLILPDAGIGTWDTTTVKVKGSAWAWKEATTYDDGTHNDAVAGDHKYTFTLADAVGAGKLAPHSGLLESGDKPEFVWVLTGVEDKQVGGVSAMSVASDGGTTSLTVSLNSKNNPSVTIP